MPYQIEWEKKGIRWRFFGIVTSQEAVQSNLDIYGDSRFDSIRYQIADFSEVEDFQIRESDMKKIAFLDKAAARSNPRVSIAIVVPTQKLQEILENYTKYAGDTPWVTKVFKSIEAAEFWVQKVTARNIQ